ncbi:MAG TPA: hypothetical protein VHV32_15950 [Candidatus Angelobacter sp.]|nr:hypothetical protein [Candidatus Angelobacter sp.]
MPLARILTRNPERTADLSSQLKQQGYSVEVARPDQTNLPPADLEIEFEVCERADVLDRAADLATELGADVAVAPGVLQMPPKPAADPIMYGSTAPQPVMAEPIAPDPISPQPVLSQKITPEPEQETVMQSQAVVAQDQERDPERDFEAAFAPVIEMPVAAQEISEAIEAPVMEQEPMPPVAFLEEPPALKPIAAEPMAERYSPEAEHYHEVQNREVHAAFSEQTRAADPMPYLAQLTPFSGRSTRMDASKEDKQQNVAASVGRHEPPQVQVRGKKVLQDGARVAAQTWAGALALAASTRASVRDHFEEYRKRAQVRSAEARAEHAARLLDLEQRRAEAHQRAAELETAREQAAARLMELVREREPGLPTERLREQMPFEPVVPKQRQPAPSFYVPPVQDRRRAVPPVAASKRGPVVRPARAAITATPLALWRSIHPPLRPILAGAAAVTTLFIVGIALGLFHSSPSPMASTTTHPSNGVTVQTGAQTAGVTLQTGTPKQQAAQPTATQQTKPQPGQPTQAQSAETVAKPSPRVRQTHLVADQSEKQIGDDVVIRHYSRPVPTQKPKQAGQQAGLKHFSDLEN